MSGGGIDCVPADHLHQHLGVLGRAHVDVIIKVNVKGATFRRLPDNVIRPRPQFASRIIMCCAVFKTVETDINDVGCNREIHRHSLGTESNVRSIVLS